MKILKFTGKSKSEKYTTIRVKESDVNRLLNHLNRQGITMTWHDLFTQLINVYFECVDLE